MSRLHMRRGWLLYAQPDLFGGSVVSGDVFSYEMSMDHSRWGSSLRIVTEMEPGVQVRQGPVNAALWEALQSWPEPGTKDGREWPPEMRALLALARNHPEEYERLREGEAVLKVLGGR